MENQHKFWIYDVIIKITSITFLFTLILFFFYFISSSQGLSVKLAYDLIGLISISAICTMLIAVLKIVVSIVKRQSALKRIKGIISSIIVLIITVILFVIINTIYLLSNG